MSDLAKLEQIGHELAESYRSGDLTFRRFQELYLAAEQACGADWEALDHLEMFSPLAKDPSWREWLVERGRERQRLRVA